MSLILIVIVIGLLGFLPSMWVRHVMAKNAGDRPDLPGTGGELARHLLDEAGLKEVGVNVTPTGDHYDPETRTVNLTRQNFEGRSITAVAVAALAATAAALAPPILHLLLCSSCSPDGPLLTLHAGTPGDRFGLIFANGFSICVCASPVV